MLDPIVAWFAVAAVSGSLALIVLAWAHHARLARLGALIGISAMVAAGFVSGFAPERGTHAVSIRAPAARVWNRLAERRVYIVDARSPTRTRLIVRRTGPHRRHAVARPTCDADALAEILPWFLALGLAVASSIGSLVSRRGWGWILVFASSALALLVLPLARPPAELGLLWTLGTLAVIAGYAARGRPDHVPRF